MSTFMFQISIGQLTVYNHFVLHYNIITALSFTNPKNGTTIKQQLWHKGITILVLIKFVFLYTAFFSYIDDDKRRQIKKKICVCLIFDIFVLWFYFGLRNNTSVPVYCGTWTKYRFAIHFFKTGIPCKSGLEFRYWLGSPKFWFELKMVNAFVIVSNTNGKCLERLQDIWF